MHPTLLLFGYCALCVVASLVGGWVPLLVRLTHRRMQIAISFVSGMILGIGLLHLLPHAFFALGSIDRTVQWVMGGFLFMFFLERFFHFHHHEIADEPLLLGAPLAHGDHDHDAQHVHGPACHVGQGRHAAHGAEPHGVGGVFSWGGAAVGLTLHGLLDGAAMGAAVWTEAGEVGVKLAGLGACLAVALHKPLDSLTVGTLMAASGRSRGTRHLVNALYALVTPLGVLLFSAVAGSFGHPSQGLGQVLAFAAGAFVCIATSDLLPELQFHRHDRLSLSIALLAGIALAWSLIFLESAGHDHTHPAAAHGMHDHDKQGEPAHQHSHEHGEHEHEHAGHAHEGHSHEAHAHEGAAEK